eukprot:2577029-Amphidinium_carterae.1
MGWNRSPQLCANPHAVYRVVARFGLAQTLACCCPSQVATGSIAKHLEHKSQAMGQVIHERMLGWGMVAQGGRSSLLLG